MSFGLYNINFQSNITEGGDDALEMIISKALKCRIGRRAYMATDLTVLILSVSYISKGNILVSLVTVMISSFIIGKVQMYEKA